MGIRVEPTTSDDLESIARLLRAAFGLVADAPIVNPALMRWKYLDAAVVHQTPCSYVVRQGDDIVAHCGVIPLTLQLPHPGRGKPDNGAVSALTFFDWAGDRRIPGAAVILLKKLLAHAAVAIVPGGSDSTRAVLPKLGFSVRQKVDLFAKVIRPLRQARSRPATNGWHDGLRLLRNTLWSLAPGGRIPNGWRVIPTQHFAELSNAASHATLPRRAPEYLNHWLRCPVGKISAFKVLRHDLVVGHCLLSSVGGQSRVAELRVASRSQSDLEIAYRLALQTAARDFSTCEVLCTASTPAIAAALDACGLRGRGAIPLFVHDPGGVLQDAPPLVWSMIEDDAAYIYDPVSPYAT